MKMITSLAVIGLNIYSVFGDAVIGNGKVVLGVNEYADLNVPYPTAGVLGCPAGADPLGVNQIGLRNADCLYASTEPGCQCEGWGVGIPNLSIEFGANQDSGGYVNIVTEPFVGVNGGNTATATTKDSTGRVRVIHEFGESDSMYAMEVLVTIENIGSEDFDATIYRRAMDWDITPTEFNEYVTIGGATTSLAATDTPKLIHSSDNGFCNSRVLTTPDCGCRDCACKNQDCEDSGPRDHGAQFDFDLGPLEAGKSLSFKIFYGTAPGEVKAEQALYDVKAEVWSLGQQAGDPSGGLPWTFFFGFAGVGGEVIDPGCDEEDAEGYNVMFVIDESGSVRLEGYTASINFVKDLINNDISAASKISIFEFATSTNVIWYFNDQQTPRTGAGSMIAALDAATHLGGGTDTEEAIREAVDEYTRAETDGDLAPGDRLLFLITDGVGSSPCAHKAALDALGVKVYIIAVGGFSADFTKCLVDDEEEQIIRLTDFGESSFAFAEDVLADVLCPGEIVVPDEPLNCAEAQIYCKDVLGSNLASVADAADITAAVAALDEAGEDYGWIGLYSDEVETSWRFRSESECTSASAYKCVDFWCTNPGGEAFRPRCIGPTEGGYTCAVFYKDGTCVDNDAPETSIIPFLCDPAVSPIRRRRRRRRTLATRRRRLRA